MYSEDSGEGLPTSSTLNIHEQSESSQRASSQELDFEPSTSNEAQALVAQDVDRKCGSRLPKSPAKWSFFAISALVAWRNSREKVDNLTDHMKTWRSDINKSKTQLNKVTSLYLDEKTRNSDLNLELKSSIEDLSLHKCSSENLTTEIISCEADREVLEHDLQNWTRDIERLKMEVQAQKAQLNAALQTKHELQMELAAEKLKGQAIEMAIKNLEQDRENSQNDMVKTEEEYTATVKSKMEDHCEAREKIKAMQCQVELLKKNEPLLKEVHETQRKLEKERDALLDQLNHSSWSYHLTDLFPTTLRIFHWMTFYLLPATPPPKKTLSS